MYTMEDVEYKYKVSDRPRSKVLKGKKYELVLWVAFKELELGLEVVYHPYGCNGRIDFKWDSIGAELEAKRLVDTEYCDCAWIKEQIIDRFTDKNVKFRVAVITERKWGKKENDYLDANGIFVIETGQICTKRQQKRAMNEFKNGIADLIIEQRRIELEAFLECGG